MVARDLHKLTYRLHEQRQRLAPNLEYRRNYYYLTSIFHAQIGADKGATRYKIDRLQPGLRRVYLMHRMKKLDERAAGMRPIGV